MRAAAFRVMTEEARTSTALKSSKWTANLYADHQPDQIFGFFVDSATMPGHRHTVHLDILPNAEGTDFNGGCDCLDFQIPREYLAYDHESGLVTVRLRTSNRNGLIGSAWGSRSASRGKTYRQGKLFFADRKAANKKHNFHANHGTERPL